MADGLCIARSIRPAAAQPCWDLLGGLELWRERDKSDRARLEPPRPPVSSEEWTQKDMAVWRVMKLVVEPLRLTVMVRSPDAAAVRDNPTALRRC